MSTTTAEPTVTDQTGPADPFPTTATVTLSLVATSDGQILLADNMTDTERNALYGRILASFGCELVGYLTSKGEIAQRKTAVQVVRLPAGITVPVPVNGRRT